MSNKYLIVVDVQNDFTTGALGTEEAKQIIQPLLRKVRNFDGTVIFTKDTHSENYLSTQEGSMLPVTHCVSGTSGWQLIDELEKIRVEKNLQVYTKNTFASLKLAQDLQAVHIISPIESIELIGICTDICVVSNALLLKSYFPEVPIFVDPACCAGVTPQKHISALDTMRSCQIIVKSDMK